MRGPDPDEATTCLRGSARRRQNRALRARPPGRVPAHPTTPTHSPRRGDRRGDCAQSRSLLRTNRGTQHLAVARVRFVLSANYLKPAGQPQVVARDAAVDQLREHRHADLAHDFGGPAQLAGRHLEHVSGARRVRNREERAGRGTGALAESGQRRQTLRKLIEGALELATRESDGNGLAQDLQSGRRLAGVEVVPCQVSSDGQGIVEPAVRGQRIDQDFAATPTRLFVAILPGQPFVGARSGAGRARRAGRYTRGSCRGRASSPDRDRRCGRPHAGHPGRRPRLAPPFLQLPSSGVNLTGTTSPHRQERSRSGALRGLRPYHRRAIAEPNDIGVVCALPWLQHARLACGAGRKEGLVDGGCQLGELGSGRR